MDTASAMSALREKLEATFGKAVAMMILASASNAAQVPTHGMSNEEFAKLVDVTCADQRVLDMWGSAGAADASATLKQLV